MTFVGPGPATAGPGSTPATRATLARTAGPAQHDRASGVPGLGLPVLAGRRRASAAAGGLVGHNAVGASELRRPAGRRQPQVQHPEGLSSRYFVPAWAGLEKAWKVGSAVPSSRIEVTAHRHARGR